MSGNGVWTNTLPGLIGSTPANLDPGKVGTGLSGNVQTSFAAFFANMFAMHFEIVNQGAQTGTFQYHPPVPCTVDDMSITVSSLGVGVTGNVTVAGVAAMNTATVANGITRPTVVNRNTVYGPGNPIPVQYNFSGNIDVKLVVKFVPWNTNS